MGKTGERYGAFHCSAVTKTRTGHLCAVVALCGLLAFGATDIHAQGNPDFDGNGKVEFTDFLVFAAGFGKQANEEGFDVRLDLGGNGAVDFKDFLIFVAAFSQSSTETNTAPEETDSTGVWSTRAQLLEPNSEMAVAQLDDKIYVIGGYPSTRVSVATVQVYDATTDSWTLTTPLDTNDGDQFYAMHYSVPANWYDRDLDDSTWPNAYTYTNRTVGVNNKPAYTNFTDLFDDPEHNAQFIWSSNLILDNEVIVRYTVK